MKRNVVDIIAHNSQLLNDYRTLFDGYAKAKAALREKEEECEKDRANEDFLRFQADELAKAQLVDGEQEELEQSTTSKISWCVSLTILSRCLGFFFRKVARNFSCS